MDKFKKWFADFSRGRYGQDEFNRALCITVIILLAISLVTQFLALALGTPLTVVSRVANWIGFIALFYMFFRLYSRNFEKRRAENEWYLEKKRKFEQKRQKREARNNKEYKYLTCAQCGQEMRVPRGKGTIKVKCPKCNQETIVKS